MRPTIARCSNRTTSKTSILTLNEQRNQIHSVIVLDTRKALLVQKRFRLSKIFSFEPRRKVRYQFVPNPFPKIISSRSEFCQAAPPRALSTYTTISVKIFVSRLSFKARPSGVFPSGETDCRSACSFPAPEASTQTWRAAAIAE